MAKTPLSKDVRLLPAVIGVGVILFGLKAAGLAFPAHAADPANPEAKPTETHTEVEPESALSTDPTKAIDAALPIPPKDAHAEDTSIPATNALSDELAGAGVTQAEMDVLTSLSDRRDALEQRRHQLDLQANVMTAAEKRVDAKIAELKSIQAKIENLLGQRDEAETAQLNALVKTYTAMKPKDAGRIFEKLETAIRLDVAWRMKPDVLAAIMAQLTPDTAQKLTVELANRLKLPEEKPVQTAALAPAPSAPAAPVAQPQTVAPAATQSDSPMNVTPTPVATAPSAPSAPVTAAPAPAGAATPVAPASTPAPQAASQPASSQAAAPQQTASVPAAQAPKPAPVKAAPAQPVPAPAAATAPQTPASGSTAPAAPQAAKPVTPQAAVNPQAAKQGGG